MKRVLMEDLTFVGLQWRILESERTAVDNDYFVLF